MLTKAKPFSERTSEDWIALREKRANLHKQSFYGKKKEKKKTQAKNKGKKKTTFDKALSLMSEEQRLAVFGLGGKEKSNGDKDTKGFGTT